MTYRFGVFEFDDDSGELLKSGRVVALEPQPARALAVLLTRADQLVARDQLKDAVWGKDTHVDFDRGLAYCISQIRTALGDAGGNPRFIQTIPKKGDRFIAPVHRSSTGPDAPVIGAVTDFRAGRLAVERVSWQTAGHARSARQFRRRHILMAPVKSLT